MQLTIYHQLIGTPCKFLNTTGIVVDVIMINKEPNVMLHTKFVEAKQSAFHNQKWVYSVIYTVEQFEELQL